MRSRPNYGLLQFSDNGNDADFSAGDEEYLTQLAQLTATTLDLLRERYQKRSIGRASTKMYLSGRMREKKKSTDRKWLIMFSVCPQCGEYCVEKTIDPSGPFAICPVCQYAHPFLQQPLFIITGPSGAGKTTACLALVPQLQECVVLESDILWGTFPVNAENNYQDYRNLWLRLAKNIGQAGRPVVLCGTALPDQFENCTERRYFSTLHYFAMICDDALLKKRLQSRPQWRGSGSDEFVSNTVRFNRWLKKHAATTKPPMTLYDNSQHSIEQTVQDIAQWARERL